MATEKKILGRPLLQKANCKGHNFSLSQAQTVTVCACEPEMCVWCQVRNWLRTWNAWLWGCIRSPSVSSMETLQMISIIIPNIWNMQAHCQRNCWLIISNHCRWQKTNQLTASSDLELRENQCCAVHEAFCADKNIVLRLLEKHAIWHLDFARLNLSCPTCLKYCSGLYWTVTWIGKPLYVTLRSTLLKRWITMFKKSGGRRSFHGGEDKHEDEEAGVNCGEVKTGVWANRTTSRMVKGNNGNTEKQIT